MSPRSARIRTVAIYARLSVTTEESVSIERQVEAARKYAEARGWTVALVAVDDGVSATKNRPEDRAGWRRILDSGERFEAVVIWKADRLARRVLDFLHADEALVARGAGLVCVEDPIDMTTAQGRAFATMLAVFAEMEAAAISSRVTAARQALVKAGRRAGGRPPFGFRNVENPDGPGMVLAHDPATIGVVRELAARAAAGASLYSLARWLEESGVEPRARKGRKDAARWHEASVEAILRAPALAGMTPFTPGRKPGEEVAVDVLRGPDGLPIVDESLAIMSPAEWRAMLATLDAAKRPGSRPRAGAEVALLYGIARCASCEGLMHRASTAGGKYTQYRCNTRGCAAPASVSRPALEEHVVAEVLKVAGHLPVSRVEVDGEDDVAPALAEIEAAIGETLSRLSEIDDEGEEERLTERLRTLKAARRTARAAESTPRAHLVETGLTFGEVLASDSVAGKRDALLSALLGVFVSPGKRGRTFDADRVDIAWSR